MHDSFIVESDSVQLMCIESKLQEKLVFLSGVLILVSTIVTVRQSRS